MLKKGCQGILALVKDVEAEGARFEDTPVVNKYIDVFLEELLELPPKREIKFCINLIPSTQPISILPYRIAPIELKILKD